MSSFELEIDELSQVGSMYMARVANEIRRAASIEKASRKITQQMIADKIGTSRAVINREMQGLENLTARRTAELLWALGWEPYFEARRIPDRLNDIVPPAAMAPRESDGNKRGASALDEKKDEKASAAEMAYAR